MSTIPAAANARCAGLDLAREAAGQGDAATASWLARFEGAPDLPCPALVEQSHAVSQEHRDEMDLEFVEQPGLEVLLDEARAAGDRDVPITANYA